MAVPTHRFGETPKKGDDDAPTQFFATLTAFADAFRYIILLVYVRS
jgi:hypothetical protein